MVGLLDVAPVPRHVEIDGQRIDVPGVSVEGIAILLELFPQFMELKALLDKQNKDQDLAAVLISLGPKVLHHVLAAGLGYPGNEEAIERVRAMDVTAQADVLDAVLAKTLSKGLDHFLARIESIKATLRPPASLADKVQEAVRRKKLSSSPSTSSSDGRATAPTMSGA